MEKTLISELKIYEPSQPCLKSWQLKCTLAWHFDSFDLIDLWILDTWSKIGYLLITGGWYMGYNRGGLAWGQLTNYAFVAQCSLHADYVGDHDDHYDEDEVSTGDYCQLCPWIPHTWILHICPFWYPIALVTPKKYTKNAQIHDNIAKNVQNGRFLR